MTGKLEAGDRLRRLLAILPWLAREGGASIAEVAERFGMREPEVVAELELAACCGLPPYSPDQLIELIVSDDWVTANPGRHLSRPQRFTPAEGFTLAASARAILAVPGADPDGALARALAKLEAVLGERKVAIDLDEPAHLDPVRQAISDRERLEVDYYSASRDEITTRQIDPYVVFARDGHWYVDAWCHLAGDVRHFRVDRLQSVRPTGERFEVPAAEVPDEVFAPGSDAQEVTIVMPVESRWVVEAYPTGEVVDLGDGRLQVTLAVGGRAWLERLLLRLGPAARVVAPDELAGVGREAAARLLAAYR